MQEIKTSLGYIAIELDPQEAQDFVTFRRYYLQFRKFIDHKVFEPEYTGKVILDIKDGRIREFDKGLKIHYEN